MGYQKPEQGDASENNAVIPEGLEIVVSNIAKKEANTIDADQIGKNHGKKEHEPFRPRKVSSMFKKLQKARSRHHRDTEDEREPIIGAPEREVPGISARHWKRPILKHKLQERSSTFVY